MKLKYLVTGCGRSGTVFLARFLTSIGVVCGHEAIFDYHGYDYAVARLNGALEVKTSDTSSVKFVNGSTVPEPVWIDESKIEAESSYLAAPFLNSEVLKETQIIHLVRNPIKVINSFCNYFDYFKNRHPALWMTAKLYESFIFGEVPEMYFDMTQLERGALYYIRWNQMIEKQNPNFRYRIEDPIEEVFEFLNIPKQDHFNDQQINSYKRPLPTFNLNQLPTGTIKSELIEMGERYGYCMNSKNFI